MLQLLLLACFPALVAVALADEDHFVPLFNGENLDGWVQVNCAPKTFTVRDGMIVCTGVPTGVMRTDRHYENFVLELEWKHMHAGGNSGLFVWSDPLTAPGVPFTRSIEVQILDGRNSETHTSHGDIFAIHGAKLTPDRPHPSGAMRCLPSEWRCKPAGQWNHYRVTCRGGTIKLEVNGKEVSGGHDCVPRKGYICLESEGSEIYFRDLRIRELPTSSPPPEEVAEFAQPFRSLYTGLNLDGWRADPGHEGHWRANDWRLDYDGNSQAEDKNLLTEEEFGDFVLICDWRFTGKSEPTPQPVILPNGEEARDGLGSVVRAAVTARVATGNPPGRWNRSEITMRGERLTVVLNGQTVIENALLPGVPLRGPIALQHHVGDPIQFANIFIKELD